MKSYSYKITLNRKVIDTVFATSPEKTIHEREEEIRTSLINHDGYDPNIKVREQRPPVKWYYSIQGNCGYGWEEETAENTLLAAREQVKCYRENVNYPMRIVRKREEVE